MTLSRQLQTPARTLGAIILALAVGALLIRLAGRDPLSAYQVLFHEAFVDYWGIANSLVKMCPIALTALAVVLPYRAGLFNIGGEGQIYIGGLFAALVGLNLPACPPLIGILLVLIAGALGGGLWAAIAGVLRAKRGVNEVVVTLLLNFVAIHIVSFAVNGPMLAAGAPYPYSEELPEFVRLPILLAGTDTHIGILLVPVLAILMHAHFTRSVHGHALDIIGKSHKAARYAGLAVEREMIVSLMLGGAMAGLAGAIEVAGVKYRLFHLFSGGYGFDGLVVAFMAGGQPLLVPLAALFMAGLKAGAGAMQRAIGVDATIIEALRGLIVMFVAAGVSATNAPLASGLGNRLVAAFSGRLRALPARRAGQ